MAYKTLSQALNESKSSWNIIGGDWDTHIDSVTLATKNRKKYGFVSYNPDSDAVFVMTFDSADDLREYYGTDATEWEDIEKTKIGDTYIDEHNALYMRIW